MASVAKASIPPMASLKVPDAPLPTLPSRVSSAQAATAPDFRQQLTTTASLAVTQPPPSSSSNAKTHSTILAPLTAAQPPSSSSLDLNLSSTALLSGTIEAVTPKPLNVHNTGVRVGHITTQQAAARILYCQSETVKFRCIVFCCAKCHPNALRDLLTDESAQRTQAQTEVVRLRIEHEQLLKNLRDEREAREKADRSLVRLQLEYMARVESEHILGIQLAEEREKRVRAEERSAQVEKELQEVKTTRAEALEREGQRRTCVERVLADVRREQGTVFVVPAMLDAFEKIAYFSDKAMVTTRT
ncbi:hypothetical protein EUX98_g6841 [Antrodiella citrinella]|uniref:Uncharacterized protein n=1 Tax=Antrodiella citrinella TaxID=2447956 RepID=A0A4V3XHZ8_9APHY|nr:hypothetical protein EUX98_g6841 [Antrodiella citrinella]